QGVGSAVSIRLQMANRGRDAMAAQNGHQAIRVFAMGALTLRDGHDHDLFGGLQKGQGGGYRPGGLASGLPGDDNGFGNGGERSSRWNQKGPAAIDQSRFNSIQQNSPVPRAPDDQKVGGATIFRDPV